MLHGGILPLKPWGSARGVVPDTPTKGRGASTPRFLARGRPVYDPGIVKIREIDYRPAPANDREQHSTARRVHGSLAAGG